MVSQKTALTMNLASLALTTAAAFSEDATMLVASFLLTPAVQTMTIFALRDATK